MANAKTSQNQKLTSRDIVFGAINGLIFGALLPVVLKNMNIQMSASKGVIIAIAFTVLAAVGVAIGYFLSKYIKIIFQIAKFGCVGAANFAVDIGILNLLIFLSGSAAGVIYIVFKVISFTFAVTNSYIWNKIWTFKKTDTKETGKEFSQFIMVSVIGLILNAARRRFSRDCRRPNGRHQSQNLGQRFRRRRFALRHGLELHRLQILGFQEINRSIYTAYLSEVSFI